MGKRRLNFEAIAKSYTDKHNGNYKYLVSGICLMHGINVSVLYYILDKLHIPKRQIRKK